GQRVGVAQCEASILREDGVGVLCRTTDLVGGRQPLGHFRSPLGRERIVPEQAVVCSAEIQIFDLADAACVPYFIDVTEALDGRGESVIRVAVEGPIELLVEVIHRSLFWLPCAGSAVEDAPPVKPVE